MGEHSSDHYIQTFQRVLDEECERLARIEKRQQALARGDHNFGQALSFVGTSPVTKAADSKAVESKRKIGRQRKKTRELVWAPDCSTKTKTKWSIPRRLSLEEKKALYKERPDLDLLGLLQRLENNFGRPTEGSNVPAQPILQGATSGTDYSPHRDYLAELVESEIRGDIERAQSVATTASVSKALKGDTTGNAVKEGKESDSEDTIGTISTSMPLTGETSETFYECSAPSDFATAVTTATGHAASSEEGADDRIEDEEKRAAKGDSKGKGYFWGNIAFKGKARAGAKSPAYYS